MVRSPVDLNDPRLLSIFDELPLCGVGEQIPLRDGSIDLVVSNNGLNHVADLGRTLAECRRVARPGAQLVATMNLPETMALRRSRPGDAAEPVIRILRERTALYRVRHPDTPRETRWLSLQLRLDSHASGVGAPLEATVELTNAGDEPLLVNRRLALNTATAPRAQREVWFEVTGPGEQPRDFQAKVKIGPPQPGDAVELAPGASISHAWNLADYFDLREPGTYWIRANYGSAPLADRQGRAVWGPPLTFGWLLVERRR
jgi:SAM-dependent methyltransferase